MNFDSMSAGIGLAGDLAQTKQSFSTEGLAQPRASIALGIAALGTLQVALWQGIFLELELGPWIHFQKTGYTYAGAISEEVLTTTTLWWGGLKMGYKL